PPIKVSDEAVHKELGDRIERAATTASSLEVEQDNAKIKYDKYCDKMLNKRVLEKIINCDVLSKGNGPNTLKVCLKRTRAGWTTIYSQIQTRMENLYKTEHELEIEFNKPLGEQDPIIKLNDLARKKRKHADDIHEYFRQDFVSIKDFGDFTNEMMYIVQEIFFILHQGPDKDDHAWTFSSFLLAEVDKRNLNPLKQMRAIEQLRQ
ncbi:hypothetical protein Tco_0960467, partial [Tanacetum coccineum]